MPTQPAGTASTSAAAVRGGTAANVRPRPPRLARTAVAALGVACVAVAAVTTGGAAATWEQPTDVLAAGTGGLPAGLGPQGWRNDGSAEDGMVVAGGVVAGGVAGGPVGGGGGVGSGVWGDVTVDDWDGWDDWGTWQDGVAGEDPFGDAYEIPGFEEPLAAAYPSGLGHGDISAPSVRAYRAAAAVLARERPGCGIDWALLAGIGRVESNHGRYGGAVVTTEGVSVPGIYGPRLDGSLAGTMVIRDTDGGALDGDPVYDRAVGPMQFIPGTWARWGSDGDRDGVKNPQDIDDAALAAARYLCSGGDDVTGDGVRAAVRRYNNSTEYVNLVLATARGYRDGTVAAAPAYSGPVSGEPGPPGWDPPTVVYPGAPSGGGSGWTGGGAVAPAQPEPATTTPRPSATADRPSTRPTTQPSTRPSTRPSTQPTTTAPTPRPSTQQPSTRPSAPSTSPTTPPSTKPSPGTPSTSQPPATTPPATTPSTTTPSTTTPSTTTPPTTTPPTTTPSTTTPSTTTPPSDPPSSPPTSVPPSDPPPSPPASEPAPSPDPSGPSDPLCQAALLNDESGELVDKETGEPVEGCGPGGAPGAAASASP